MEASSKRLDHTCSTRWAVEHGLAETSPMKPTWCITYKRDAILRQRRPDPMVRSLRLWHEGRLALHYAPWDWVNTKARVMLVGITAGMHQAKEALREAQRCLREGMPTEEVLRRADAIGSFSGPMRARLVAGLDRAGLAHALGIASSASLFDDGADDHLLGTAAAIGFPLFNNGENYNGYGPRLDKDPTLRALVRAYLGAKVQMVPRALVLPLGKPATDAVQLLVDTNLLDASRCVRGFPHPSTNNGHYWPLLDQREEKLRRQLKRASLP